jgi:glycosyltransferase involved in cell wall biosynthesis
MASCKINDKVLSICIATYNRAKRCKDLVDSILKNNNPKLEVVVVDNCSTDETCSMFENVTDYRFKFYVNEKPLQPAHNFVNALIHGTGKYVFYCNDRDLIDADGIDGLISWLEGEELGWVHCREGDMWQSRLKSKDFCLMYDKGAAALSNIQPTDHPTGHIFNRYLLDDIPFDSLAKYQTAYSYFLLIL